jgi:hypothetical protein
MMHVFSSSLSSMSLSVAVNTCAFIYIHIHMHIILHIHTMYYTYVYIYKQIYKNRSIHLLQKSKGHSGSDNGAKPFCKLEIWPYKKSNKSNVFIHSCSSGIGVFSVISPIMDLQKPYNFLELSE